MGNAQEEKKEKEKQRNMTRQNGSTAKRKQVWMWNVFFSMPAKRYGWMGNAYKNNCWVISRR